MAGVHRVGVVAALRSEARCLTPRGARVARSQGLLIEAGGMGCERAARTAHALVRAGARSLLCWGVAGALDPALRCGDVVLAREVICEAPLALQIRGMRPLAVPAGARLRTSERWRAELQSALLAHGPVSQGVLLTRLAPVCEAREKARLFQSTAAVAVDMESAAVAAVAMLYELPFMALRVIVDTATDALPPAVAALAAPHALGPFGFVTWLPLFATPNAWPGLVRLSRRWRVARAALRECATRLPQFAAAPVP